MSISTCRVCLTQYDQDYNVEHEIDCMYSDFELHANEWIKRNKMNESEYIVHLKHMDTLEEDNLEEYINSIKLRMNN